MTTRDADRVIVPMILNAVKTHLESELQIELPDGDPTKPALIKIGRFQDNPIKNNLYVAISGGDYEDPTYQDGRIDHTDMDQFQIRNLPVGEIGGGIFWWRRCTINFATFFVRDRYTEEVAMAYAYEYYGRLQRAMDTVRLNFADDYEEQATGTPFVESASFFESGGKNQFIWRGKMRFRVLTWRP